MQKQAQAEKNPFISSSPLKEFALIIVKMVIYFHAGRLEELHQAPSQSSFTTKYDGTVRCSEADHQWIDMSMGWLSTKVTHLGKMVRDGGVRLTIDPGFKPPQPSNFYWSYSSRGKPPPGL